MLAVVWFSAKLFRHSGAGGWTFVAVPKRFAPSATKPWGRAPVTASVEGRTWETSVWHDRTLGAVLPVPKGVRAGKREGDTVTVELRSRGSAQDVPVGAVERPRLSSRLAAAVDALPLEPGLRVLEIGCGPGAALREVARRVAPDGHVLGIDRSERAIRQAREACAAEVAAGLVSLRCVAVEELTLLSTERRFQLAFALRVGALDGRHPEAGARALPRVAAALVRAGKLFVGDGGDLRAMPLRASSGRVVTRR